MFEIVAGELRAKLGTVSAMRQVRSGRDTCAVAGPGWTTSRHTRPHISTPRPTGVEGAGGICRGARGRRRGLARQHTDTPTDWRPPRGLRGLAGLRADAPSEARGADGERAGRPRGGRRSVGATSNNSRRGRRAGGPPPTGTHSGRAIRHPEHPWGHTQRRTSGGTTSNANARQPTGPPRVHAVSGILSAVAQPPPRRPGPRSGQRPCAGCRQRRPG